MEGKTKMQRIRLCIISTKELIEQHPEILEQHPAVSPEAFLTKGASFAFEDRPIQKWPISRGELSCIRECRNYIVTLLYEITKGQWIAGCSPRE
jgi:hypothetical protein